MSRISTSVSVITESIEWTPAEKLVACAILEKIAYCQNRGGDAPLPGEVFEAHCRSKVNVSTELVLVNDNGDVYLVKRPEAGENPTDPYAGLLHAPGATWNKGESFKDTFDRLRRSEGISFTEPVRRDVRVMRDDKRGTYLACIFVALATRLSTNPRGKFFPIAEIPWDKLVRSHAEVVLPAGLGMYRFGARTAEAAEAVVSQGKGGDV